MKLLSELLGVKRYKDRTTEEMVDFLSKASPFKFKGSGVMGKAFALGDVVYKFWYNDKVYENFVAFARTANSQCVPKFYTPVKTIPNFLISDETSPKKIKYVKMEMLEESSKGKLKIKTPGTITIFDLTDIIFAGVRSEHGVKEEMIRLLKKRLKTEDVPADYVELTNVVQALVTKGILDQKSLDIHAENVMFRGDTPVIIDPGIDDKDFTFNDSYKHLEQQLMKIRDEAKVTDKP